MARLSSRWTLVVDHSILTASTLAGVAPARVDHLAVSAGRRLLGSGSGVGARMHVGAGLRYSGEAAGSRMQNGFHQLVGSTLETGLVLQTGLSGWLPASTQTVDFSGHSERLLRPSLALTLGVLTRIRVGSREGPSRTAVPLHGAGKPDA